MLETKIPEIAFFMTEFLILVFVFFEFILGWKSYALLKRKRGRPRKTKVEKLMVKLSKQLKQSIARNKEDE